MEDSEARKLKLIFSIEQLKTWARTEWEYMTEEQREVFSDALSDETCVKDTISKRVMRLARISALMLDLEHSYDMETVFRNTRKNGEQEASDRICKNLCPACAASVVIVLSHPNISKILCDVDCTSCNFHIRNGIWNKDEGYCGEQRNM